MAWGVCDGHDLYEVRAVMDDFLKAARDQSRPAVVEVRTYRYRGHSVADPDNTYRAKAEIEDYRARPRTRSQVFQQILVDEKVLDDAKIEKIDGEARAEADVSADFAEASPFPDASDLQKDVYWEADNPSQRKSEGRLFFN